MGDGNLTLSMGVCSSCQQSSNSGESSSEIQNDESTSEVNGTLAETDKHDANKLTVEKKDDGKVSKQTVAEAPQKLNVEKRTIEGHEENVNKQTLDPEDSAAAN